MDSMESVIKNVYAVVFMRVLDEQLRDQVESSVAPAGAGKRRAGGSPDDDAGAGGDGDDGGAESGEGKQHALKKSRKGGGGGVAEARQATLAKASAVLAAAQAAEDARVKQENARANALTSALTRLVGGDDAGAGGAVDYMKEIKKKVEEKGAGKNEVKAIMLAVAKQLSQKNEALLRSVLGQLDDVDLDRDFILQMLNS